MAHAEAQRRKAEKRILAGLAALRDFLSSLTTTRVQKEMRRTYWGQVSFANLCALGGGKIKRIAYGLQDKRWLSRPLQLSTISKPKWGNHMSLCGTKKAPAGAFMNNQIECYTAVEMRSGFFNRFNRSN
ncbi:MAG: hypothetical protein R3A44_17270 [Caldilineaceae bacterium]